MNKQEELKQIVKNKYSTIAKGSSCCCCNKEETDLSIFSENYKHLNGYNENADLGLGCGLPTEYAKINSGDHVLDLGSGAGNDCFVARAIVGETGRITGLDFTEEMVRKAIVNNNRLGYTNVEFIKGDIDDMPFDNNIFNVVISNCVLNLVPDKEKAFSEMFRVLKKGAHFCISDIVLEGELPEKLKKEAELYAGCVASAIQKDEYLRLIEKAEFKNIEIKKQRNIKLPDEMLLKYLNSEELKNFNTLRIGIFSITVFGQKIY